MSSTATTLTTDERMAALFAVIDDVHKLAAELVGNCEEFLNAKIGDHEFYAREVATGARTVGNLVAPLNLVIAADNGEVK